MKEETINVKVFIADDGKKFDNEKDCIRYEKKITLLNELQGERLRDDNYYVIFVESLGKISGDIIEAFSVDNPEQIKEGWNLIYDYGSHANVFNIKQVMQKLAEKQANSVPSGHIKREAPTESDILSVKAIKKELMMIINRHNQMEGSVEGKFGSLLLELDTLIKKP